MTIKFPVWVEAHSYVERTHPANHDPYFLIFAVDKNCNRVVVCCDAKHKHLIFHFLKTMNEGGKRMIPVEPRTSRPNSWYIALRHVDDVPEATDTIHTSKQLHLPEPKDTLVDHRLTKKQSFIIDSVNADKASVLANKRGITKSSLYANVVGAYIKTQEQADVIF
jgi:hypothetical protein